MEPPEFCTEFCLYQVLCEELPEGVSEFDCVESCRASLTEGGAERGLLEGYFSCTSVDTCEEFSACFGDQATEARCGRYCEARAGCDLEDNEACLEDCAARFSTTRAQIQVGCSEWMGTCEGQAACQLPEPPACERICDPLDCVDPVDCVRACDDGDLEDPDSFLRQLSCVASLAQCHTAAACLEGALEPGEACLTYCALEEKCGDDAEDRADCLLRCGHGGSGEADLALEAALLCAEGLTSESTCDAFNACLAPEPDAGCARLCEVTEGCGFAIDGCLESCPDSVDAGDIACVLNAERREGGCRAVAACLDIELPPPDPSCGALCARRAECDPSVDTFLCELDCEAGAETDSRAACAELASCERMPRCTDEPLPDSEVCAGFCDGSAFTPPAAECGAFEDPADCVPACVGRVLLYGQDVTTNLTLCTGFSECTPDAYQLCLDWMGSPCQAQVTQEMCMADRIDEHLAWGCERFLTAQQLACIRALPPGDPIGCDATACYLGF